MEGIGVNKNEHLEREDSTALRARAATLPSTEFVKVEKNLASLGFFTPSSNRLRNATEKSFTITTFADGQRLELKGTIIPSAKYGLPITADQDKWFALCKILTDIIRKEGRVTNPVSFTSAEILRLLHKHRHSGKNYREIEEWLDVLFSTTIFSEGVVYLAEEKRRVKDRFRVFERAVSFGKELPDGKVADKNYVWFSDWQLQNINANHLLPIDLEAYRELKNYIAKALVPLLQVWLYATREQGVFEKRYRELCEILNSRHYKYESLILQTLRPSLDELKQFGYIAEWRIEKTNDDEDYKVVFFHGEKFYSDRRARLSRKQKSNGEEKMNGLNDATQRKPMQPPEANERLRQSVIRAAAPDSVQPGFNTKAFAELTRVGINEQKALELLANLKPGQDVIAQIESAEDDIKRLQNTAYRIIKPAGYIIRLIQKNTPVPDGFETKAQRQAREERERIERVRHAAEEARQEAEDEWERYCRDEVDRYIKEHQAEFEAIKAARLKEEQEQHPGSWASSSVGLAAWRARSEIIKRLTLPTFEEFIARKEQWTDPSLKPSGSSAATESASLAEISSPSTPPATSEAQNPASQEALPTEPMAEPASVVFTPPDVTTCEDSQSPAPVTNAATSANPAPIMLDLGGRVENAAIPRPESATESASIPATEADANLADENNPARTESS